MERRFNYPEYAVTRRPRVNLLTVSLVLVVLGAVVALKALATAFPDDSQAPLEVHWTSLGPNGATGYVKNTSPNTVNGFQLEILNCPNVPLGDFKPVKDFAAFPFFPSAARVLAPQAEMPFTVSPNEVGELKWPPTVKLMDAKDNNLGEVCQHYGGKQAP